MALLSAANVASLFAIDGISATFTPQGGAANTLTIIHDPDGGQVEDASGNFIEAVETATFDRRALAAASLAEPQRGDALTFTPHGGISTSYVIGRFISRDEDETTHEIRSTA